MSHQCLVSGELCVSWKMWNTISLSWVNARRNNVVYKSTKSRKCHSALFFFFKVKRHRYSCSPITRFNTLNSLIARHVASIRFAPRDRDPFIIYYSFHRLSSFNIASYECRVPFRCTSLINWAENKTQNRAVWFKVLKRPAKVG